MLAAWLKLTPPTPSAVSLPRPTNPCWIVTPLTPPLNVLAATVGCAVPDAASVRSLTTAICGTSRPANLPWKVMSNAVAVKLPTDRLPASPTIGRAANALTTFVAVVAKSGSKVIGSVTYPPNAIVNVPPVGVFAKVRRCTSFAPVIRLLLPPRISEPAPVLVSAPPVPPEVMFPVMVKSSRPGVSPMVNVRAPLLNPTLPAIVAGAPAAFTVTLPPSVKRPLPVCTLPPVMFRPVTVKLPAPPITLPSPIVSTPMVSFLSPKFSTPERFTVTLMPAI